MATVSYSKQYPLGSNVFETISITLTIDPAKEGASASLDAFYNAKTFVESAHAYFRDLKEYALRKLIAAHPDNYAPKEVTAANAYIQDFEATYADFMLKFPPDKYTEIG